MRRALALAALVAAAGCGKNQLTLEYKLDGILPADVVRVETRVDVDPSDPRAFYVDQPYRQVAIGVGYEVRDFDGTGKKTLLVTHDATLGYAFGSTFNFRLLPPVNGSAPPLSIVARAVGVSDMIGQTMPIAGKFGDNAHVTVTLADQRCGAMSCDANQQCCGGACAPVQFDATNCGSCGHACAPTGDSCSGATCRCAGGSACAAGSTCCGGIGCVDLQSDPFHCGACDKSCAPGETCVAGACKCGNGPGCTGATAVCCSDGTCSASGACTCGATVCNFPQICCGGGCVDPRNNNTHCGMCNHACTAPLACSNGACTCNGIICANGDTCCSTGCANTSNDPGNCGMCGKRCRTGEVCSGGQCLCGTTACGPSQLCCGSTCVNQTVTNCGTCGHVCKSGEQCSGGATGGGTAMCTCNGGDACVGNQICCGSNSPGGAGCFDPSSDPKHCGDCATVCPAGYGCVTGQCVQTPCNPPCTNGNQCSSGQCRCNGSGGCDGTNTCCSDGCHDLSTDTQNCGMCGKKCADGQYCCGGVCTTPDDNNCTGCKQACGGGSFCCVCPGKPGRCSTLLCTCL